jgi:hypothetical protein
MFLNPEKNLVAWNTENLDTYHDIIVSFDFTRYSLGGNSSGGFAIVFFESLLQVPVIGGPGYSLGYTPNNIVTDYCYKGGYEGLEGAFLGIGFDKSGLFGASTGTVDGLNKPIPNTFTIRGSKSDNYKHIETSKNLFYTPKKFLISEEIEKEEDKKYRSIRVIITKAFTEIEVQIKDEQDRNFYTVSTTKIPIKKRTAVRVGLTTTFLDNFTKFDIRNFNISGFPGKIADIDIKDCSQNEKTFNTIDGKTIVSSNNFVAVPVGGLVYLYEIREGKFIQYQIIQETDPCYLIGGSDRFLFLNKKDTYEIVIYYRVSKTFLRIQTIDLKTEIYESERILIFKYPDCAHTDNKTLVIGNQQYVFVYNFYTGFSAFGRFGLFQTITDHPSGSIGFSVQVEDKKLLTGGGKPKSLGGRNNSFVAYYEYNGFDWGGSAVQTFSSPASGNTQDEFGYTIALQGNEAVIGSPNEFRRGGRDTTGQGEVYHYVYTTKRTGTGKEWRSAMGLGSFYKLDTPGGNFGTSLSFLGNNLIVSAPYEMFLYPPDLSYENIPNVGRVYIFRKSLGGIFAQAAIISPGYFEQNVTSSTASVTLRAEPYMFYGKYVGLYSNLGAVVTIPFRDDLSKGEIDFYKIGCVFNDSPIHLPVDKDKLSLVDNSGYIIDIETYQYLKVINIDAY